MSAGDEYNAKVFDTNTLQWAEILEQPTEKDAIIKSLTERIRLTRKETKGNLLENQIALLESQLYLIKNLK